MEKLSEIRKSPHLSASSISTYIDCSLAYWFAYIKRLPMEFVSDALEFGSAIHLTLADFYRAKMTGDRILLKDVHESYKRHWTTRAKDRSDIKYAEGKDFQSYLIEGVDLLTAWLNKLPADNFSVLAVEEAFVFEIDGIPLAIVGAIDLVEEDDAGTVIITDHKTTGRAYSIDEIDQNPQITIYQMAAKANGFAEREILLKFDCLVKTKTPKFEQYYTTRTETDELRLVRKIQRVWEGIHKGVFIPNDTSWKCKTCPYKQACDKWFLNGGEK
jgi:putative RecB family exonuclease